MKSVTTRCSTSFVRAGLIVTLAAGAMAISPRAAKADVMICNTSGGCMRLGTNQGLGCSAFQPLPEGLICFLVGMKIAPDAHLTHDGASGASLVFDGKPHTLVIPTPSAVASIKSLADKGRAGGIDKIAFKKAFDDAFRSSSHQVSYDAAVTFGRELNVPVSKEKSTEKSPTKVPTKVPVKPTS
jgi:hypothetical protein